MSVTEFPDLSLAREEAATWIARLDRGLDIAERAELRRWCMTGPANARALRQLSDLWGSLDVIKAVAEALPESSEGQAAGKRAARRMAARPATPRAPARSVRPLLVAGLAMVLLVAGLAARQFFTTQSANSQAAQRAAASYATTVGEQREVALADGSSLSINTGSLVEVVALHGSSRELRLLHGEALFTVAHDAARPFRVRVGEHLIEAVGAAFDVRLHTGGALEVLVTEGRVRLADGNAASYVDRGQAVVIDHGSTQITRLDADALTARLAWRQGMIVFTGQPLSVALEEFARYTPARFVITDPGIQDRPVGGSVPAGDVDSLLEALHANLGFESRREADGSIRISESPGQRR